MFVCADWICNAATAGTVPPLSRAFAQNGLLLAPESIANFREEEDRASGPSGGFVARSSRIAWALGWLPVLLLASSSLGQDAAVGVDTSIPPAREFYKGRRIAQTMHYRGADWLVRDEREREERCSLMLANLGVKPGMTVCDMGCGNGFYSLQLAKLVGPRGRVLAVDIQPEMLQLLEQRAAAKEIGNIEPILGTLVDPKLPAATVDLILCVDVYHEFSHPEQMLSAMRRSLSADGVVALLEYRAEDPRVPIKPLHKMSRVQIMKEFRPNGFKLVREYKQLPWQHMMFFGRGEAGEAGLD